MTRRTDFMAFDEYVGQLNKCHEWQISVWERNRKAIELVRKHGGSEFVGYDGCNHEPEPRPSAPDIPEPPDGDSVAPYSRVTLISDATIRGIDHYCPSLMIVFSVSGDEIEGYVDRKSWAEAGRIVVRKDKMIECLPPFMPEEVDPEAQYDDLSF